MDISMDISMDLSMDIHIHGNSVHLLLFKRHKEKDGRKALKTRRIEYIML